VDGLGFWMGKGCGGGSAGQKCREGRELSWSFARNPQSSRGGKRVEDICDIMGEEVWGEAMKDRFNFPRVHRRGRGSHTPEKKVRKDLSQQQLEERLEGRGWRCGRYKESF